MNRFIGILVVGSMVTSAFGACDYKYTEVQEFKLAEDELVVKRPVCGMHINTAFPSYNEEWTIPEKKVIELSTRREKLNDSLADVQNKFENLAEELKQLEDELIKEIKNLDDNSDALIQSYDFTMDCKSIVVDFLSAILKEGNNLYDVVKSTKGKLKLLGETAKKRNTSDSSMAESAVTACTSWIDALLGALESNDGMLKNYLVVSKDVTKKILGTMSENK